MARIAIRILIGMVAASFASGAARADCPADGSTVTLDGWLSLKAATPEQLAGGVAKGSRWSMKLAKPLCVGVGAGNPAIDSVPRVALEVGADQDKAFRAQFNKRVKVAGVLHADKQQVSVEGATLVQ